MLRDKRVAIHIYVRRYLRSSSILSAVLQGIRVDRTRLPDCYTYSGLSVYSESLVIR